MKRSVRDELFNILLIAAGLILATLGYRLYLIPNNVAPGGFTGIGQIVNHLVPAVGVGLVNLLLNVPLFLVSLRSMGLGFGLRSLISSVALSLMLDYLPVPAMTDDVLLSAVFGGVLCGAGFGLVLRGHATTGGSDMLASIVHRHVPALKVSVCLFATDATVVIASGFVFDASAAMYALISVFVMNVVIDQVLEGPGLARSHIIITNHGEKMADRILKELDRGVTAIEAKGMYSGEGRTMLLCVVSRLEAVRLRSIVYSVDPRAFVIVQNVHEALGEGFKELQK
ncbi:MAG TPA: YitT family protein [Candidatus Pullichristensenella excrementipullorum]|nr:YitT family protein [Candidatus Pullichristensenella excrementipullorum]